MNNDLLTYGNKKMTIPIFSLPATKTCTGSTAYCRKYCYAKSAEEMYPSVVAKRARSLKASKEKDFVERIVSGLNDVIFIPYVRIHESGDFYSQKYLEKWFDICGHFPNRKFLAFTKSFNLDFSNKPDNMALYYSIWCDTDMSTVPEGDNRAYTVVTYKWFKDQGLVNPDVGNAMKCKGFCDKCLVCFERKSDVYFPIHGRGVSGH